MFNIKARLIHMLSAFSAIILMSFSGIAIAAVDVTGGGRAVADNPLFVPEFGFMDRTVSMQIQRLDGTNAVGTYKEVRKNVNPNAQKGDPKVFQLEMDVDCFNVVQERDIENGVVGVYFISGPEVRSNFGPPQGTPMTAILDNGGDDRVAFLITDFGLTCNTPPAVMIGINNLVMSILQLPVSINKIEDIFHWKLNGNVTLHD